MKFRCLPGQFEITPIRVAILVGVLAVPVLIVLFTFRTVSETTTEVSKSSPDAYFSAPTETTKQRNLTGKIVKLPRPVGQSQAEYELIDENKTTLAYIFSTTNNLSLSAGMQVEIYGKITGENVNSVEIIEVENIRLK